LANGKQWSEELAKAAARDAASALASAARESAYAAANAASAPRIAARSAALVARESAYAGNYASKDDIRFRQRDLLLTLIKEAPKQQEEPLMTNTSEFIYVVTTQSADDERAFINERDASCVHKRKRCLRI